MKASSVPTSLSAIRKSLFNGDLTMERLVEQYLDNIRHTADHNIFLEVFEEEARSEAKRISEKIADNKAGRLAGMVIAIKDNLCYAGHKVSAASKMLEGFESLYTATALERLLAEDAIVIGRVNCDEFAMGGSNENSAFGPVKNPLNPQYVPGGSSGGSGAAVAAHCCLAALGSDTGGSIRQPASFTGVVGLKPTYGRVSRHGLIAFASSFDQIGPLTHHVEDAALMLEIMAGFDDMDATSSKREVPSYSEVAPSETKRIAYLADCLENEALDPQVESQMRKVIHTLKNQGHTVEPVSLEGLNHLVPTYYLLTTAEASSNLARFDGIHYGYRSPHATDIQSTYKMSRSEGFGPEVKRRILLGTFVLSAGYYDAYYGKAQKVRRLLKEKTDEIFNQYDLIISPTTPTSAFEFGKKDDPVSMYLQDIFTVHANLVGCPAISIPLFRDERNGLPIGLQVTAPAYGEKNLIDFASSLYPGPSV